METIDNPLLVIHRGENSEVKAIVVMHPDLNYKHYGLIICDAVRHVAMAYGVSEDEVWEYVDKERATPTTTITTVRRTGLT
jgi:hypothetical protein